TDTRGLLTSSLSSRGLDARRFFLPGDLLTLRLLLCRCLSRGLLTFSLSSCGLDARRFFLTCDLLTLRLLSCRCPSRGLLTSSLSSCGLDARRFFLTCDLLTLRFLYRCQPCGFLRDIASIFNRRRCGLPARSAWRYCNDRRTRRRSCFHDRCGLVGRRHVANGRLRDLRRRHAIGSIGTHRRFHRGRMGHGVSL